MSFMVLWSVAVLILTCKKIKNYNTVFVLLRILKIVYIALETIINQVDKYLNAHQTCKCDFPALSSQSPHFHNHASAGIQKTNELKPIQHAQPQPQHIHTAPSSAFAVYRRPQEKNEDRERPQIFTTTHASTW